MENVIPPRRRLRTPAGGDRVPVEALLEDAGVAQPEDRDAGTVLSRGEGRDAPLAGTVTPSGSVTHAGSVARYRIDALAGVGGMGVVERATGIRLGRTVALELIAPDVIPIHRAGEDDGQLFIAMRSVEGRSLQDLMAAIRAASHPGARRPSPPASPRPSTPPTPTCLHAPVATDGGAETAEGGCAPRGRAPCSSGRAGSARGRGAGCPRHASWRCATAASGSPWGCCPAHPTLPIPPRLPRHPPLGDLRAQAGDLVRARRTSRRIPTANEGVPQRRQRSHGRETEHSGTG